jgi:hypothetical protein
MVLQGRRIGGEEHSVADRITWTPNEDGTVHEFWETSKNEGETWKVGFDGFYTKVAVKSEKAEEDRVKGEE